MSLSSTAAVRKIVFECARIAQSNSRVSPQLDSYLAQFLSVKLCGLYEESIEQMVRDRAQRTGDAAIAAYVSWAADKLFKNPDYSTIKGMIGTLDSQKAKQLDTRFTSDKQLALNSIVTNRHSVAHGKPANVTMRDVVGFFRKSRHIVPVLEDLLK